MKNIKKRLIGWTLGLALSLGVGIGIASNTHSEITGVEAAGETTVATLAFPDDDKANNAVSAYDTTWTAKIGTNTWSISNFNNNRWGDSWTFIKCGSKKAASVATITNATPLEGVSKIALKIGAMTVSNVNSVYLQCGKTDTTITENKIVLDSLKTGVHFFEVGSSDFRFFKLTFDCKKGSKNGIVQVDSVEYNKIDENAHSITISGPQSVDATKSIQLSAVCSKGDDVTWSCEPESVATISETGLVTGVSEGTATVTATCLGAGSATYSIKVNKYYDYIGDGTIEHPFTVADAINKAAVTGGTATADTYFVKGKIAAIDEFNSTYGNMTFSVSDDGTTANVFKFFRCVADKNVKFTSDSSKTIVVGEEILGCGKILSYNGTPEFDAGCYPYDYKATSISATEPTASGWKVGDTISSVSDLGITVTADIEITGEKRDVTAEATVEPVTLADGENTITVKYTQINKYSGVTTNNTPLTTTVIANVTTTEATDMAIVTGSTTIYAGETTTLKATLSGGTNNYQRTIGWASSDTAVIANPENSVDGAEFVITGLKEGTTTLTGTVVAPGSATASVTITVKPARTETDIALHGKMLKTEYNVGDAWDLTGLDLEVSWSDGDPTYLSLDDENVVYECNPGTVNDANLTSFSLEVIFGTLDKTFVVDGFNVVVKSYASLVTSPKDLWDGQEIYFSSTAEATKVSALHTGGNNLKSVDGIYVKDKGLSINDTTNAKAYTVGRVELEGTTYYTFSFMSETGIKYLTDTGSEKNYLQLSDEIIDTTSNCVYFTISLSTDGTATIKSKSNTTKPYLMWNEGSDLFSCYSGGQKNPYLFAVTPYSETTVTNSFVDRYLHMDENVDNQCKTYYPVLKSVWAAMSLDEKLSIDVTAQARLVAWATANGEQLDGNFNLVSNANFIIKGNAIKDGNAFALIAVISMVSATAIGSFFFIRKRKEQN